MRGPCARSGPRVCRHALYRFADPGGVEARPLGKSQPLRDSLKNHSDHRLVHELRGVTRPGCAQVGHVGAERFQQRHGRRDVRLLAADQDCERSGFGTLRAARDRCVNPADIRPAQASRMLGRAPGLGASHVHYDLSRHQLWLDRCEYCVHRVGVREEEDDQWRVRDNLEVGRDIDGLDGVGQRGAVPADYVEACPRQTHAGGAPHEPEPEQGHIPGERRSIAHAITIGRVRILLVSQMYPGPRDPELGVFVRQIEEQLARLGHDVDRAVLEGRAGGRRRHLSLARRSLARARHHKPDVVYAHFLFPAGASAALAAKRANAPLVVTAHGRDVRNIGGRARRRSR